MRSRYRQRAACSTLLGALALAGCSDAASTRDPNDLGATPEGDDVAESPATEACGDVVVPFVAAHYTTGFTDGRFTRLWTGVQVQNLSQAPTRIVVDFHSPDGSLAGTFTTATPVQPNASANVIPHADLGMTGWQGYARVRAEAGNHKVAAVANLAQAGATDGAQPTPEQLRTNYDTEFTASFEGTSRLSAKGFFPFLDLDGSGDSAIWLTNASDDTAYATLAFSDGTREQVLIPPRQQRAVWLRDLDVEPAFESSQQREVTSATLLANIPISAVATGQNGRNGLTAYTPTRSGQTLLPLVNFQPHLANPIGTTLYVQRTHPDSERIEVTYHRENGETCQEWANVGMGDSIDFGWSFTGRTPPDTFLGGRGGNCSVLNPNAGEIGKRFVGWAELSPNATAVAFQNVTTRAQSVYPARSRAESLSTQISFPLAQSGNHGWWSGFALINPSEEHEAVVNCTYYSDAPGFQPRAEPQITIPKKRVAHRQQYDVFGNERFVGSMTCSSTQPFFGVMNQALTFGGPMSSYPGQAAAGPACLGEGEAAGDGHCPLRRADTISVIKWAFDATGWTPQEVRNTVTDWSTNAGTVFFSDAATLAGHGDPVCDDACYFNAAGALGAFDYRSGPQGLPEVAITREETIQLTTVLRVAKEGFSPETQCSSPALVGDYGMDSEWVKNQTSTDLLGDYLQTMDMMLGDRYSDSTTGPFGSKEFLEYYAWCHGHSGDSAWRQRMTVESAIALISEISGNHGTFVDHHQCGLGDAPRITWPQPPSRIGDEVFDGTSVDACRCGYDVTDEMWAVVDRTRDGFGALSRKNQDIMCEAVHDANSGWDILQFFNPRAQNTGHVSGTNCGIGACEGTASFRLGGQTACYRAETLNYWLWGVINSLCWNGIEDPGWARPLNNRAYARAVVWAYRHIYRPIVDASVFAAGDVRGRLDWFEAGWDAVESSQSSPGFTLPETRPSTDGINACETAAVPPRPLCVKLPLTEDSDHGMHITYPAGCADSE